LAAQFDWNLSRSRAQIQQIALSARSQKVGRETAVGFRVIHRVVFHRQLGRFDQFRFQNALQ